MTNTELHALTKEIARLGRDLRDLPFDYMREEAQVARWALRLKQERDDLKAERNDYLASRISEEDWQGRAEKAEAELAALHDELSNLPRYEAKDIDREYRTRKPASPLVGVWRGSSYSVVKRSDIAALLESRA